MNLKYILYETSRLAKSYLNLFADVAVKLPELLAYVKIEEETLIRLQQKLLDFLKYMLFFLYFLLPVFLFYYFYFYKYVLELFYDWTAA